MIVTVRWARVAMDACGVRRVPAGRNASQADGKAVWSWRRDRGVKLARGIAPMTVANNAAHRGERGISRNTIARGKPGCPGCTCGLIRVPSSSALSHTGSAGAVGARLPRALHSQ